MKNLSSHKKKQAKRKREANEAASPKRFRPPPKHQIGSPKKAVPPVKQATAMTASLPAPKAIQTESIGALVYSFSKIIREETNCILQ